MTEKSEYEPTPERNEADYESYRKVVDTFSPAFRKVGIVDATGYSMAMRDPTTVRLHIGGVELPLLARLDYAAGYDVKRSERLTGQSEMYILTMPLPVLAAPEAKILRGESAFQPEAAAVIVETDHAETADVQYILPGVLARVGEYESMEFLDRRIRNPEQQPAMMALYESQFTAVKDTGESVPRRDVDFFEAYDHLRVVGHPLTERTKLLHVDDLRDNEQLMEDLWELCHDRFDWLGDAHPVSMEDTKDFFVQMVLNDDTHTIVRYDDNGRPACLGFFMPNLDECTWLKPETQTQLTRKAEEADERIIYFFGIAGKSAKDAAHYGRDVMGLLAHISSQQGGKFRLLFESTNMSSRYIPHLVGQYVTEETGMRMTEAVRKTAQVDYWYMRPKTG